MSAAAVPLIDGLYDMIDPATVKAVPRSHFLMSLCGEIEDASSVERLLVEAKDSGKKFSPEMMELAKWAATYIELSSKGARLPKFTRWITGMWADNKEFAKIMADEGQKAVRRKVFMSVSPTDILRCADTPHFASCFKWNGASIGHRDASKVAREQFHRLPATILEECPGIGIMYVDDEQGKMMGRQWMHHAQLAETGEDVMVLTTRPYGCLRGDYIAKLLAQRGIKVALAYDGYHNFGSKPVPINYIGCFTANIHHDVDTWSANRQCIMVKA